MSGTIYPRVAIERGESRWEEHLHDLTPVELRDGMWFKREDYFAPLGYGGINGSKLRQLIALVAGYDSSCDDAGLLTAASVHSAQASSVALVGRHYELPVTIVLGASKPSSSGRHENIAIARAAGAEFVYTPVGFNPALQRAAGDLHASSPCKLRLHYGFSDPAAPPQDLAAFHALGAEQVANVPPEAHTLVMAAGSCNSCASVLIGLARHRTNIERVVLLGIGPTRLDWIDDRLAAVEAATGERLRRRYRRRYHHHVELEARHQHPAGDVLLEHYDLYATGFAKYEDRMPWQFAGIGFHPIYEGKTLRYMHERNDEFGWFWRSDGDVLYWIVGSQPTLSAMRDPLLFAGIAA